jgi:hypothetical protein
MVVATYVYLADSVVILDGKGSLTYSGPSAKWLSLKDDIAKDQDKELPEEPLRAFKPEDFEEAASQTNSEQKFDENVETVKRQRGDMAVWTYYGRSIGGFSLLVTAICICINVFGNNFQSIFWEHSYCRGQD